MIAHSFHSQSIGLSAPRFRQRSILVRLIAIRLLSALLQSPGLQWVPLVPPIREKKKRNALLQPLNRLSFSQLQKGETHGRLFSIDLFDYSKHKISLP